MVSKWHISKMGTPAPCKATIGNCPLGGDESHFETQHEAQVVANEIMEGEYGILPQNDERAKDIEEKKTLSRAISKLAGIKSTGFDYETYASLVVAEEMGLERTTIFENGKHMMTFISAGGNLEAKVELRTEMAIEALSSYYKSMGANIKDKSKLIRVMYHSEHLNRGMLIQSGGSNVLDAAIIKADKVVDIIEMKELSSQAQLPTVSLDVNKDGSITEKCLKEQDEYMREVLKDVKIQDADGTDMKIEFANEEDSKRFPLKYFVNQYRAKGATSLIYTTNNKEDVHTLDLTGDTEEVVDRLLENGIEANVTLRANMNKRNANEDDIYRFNEILSKNYFKSGRKSTAKSFKLEQIKEDKITSSGKLVRVGGYILPIEYSTYKDNLNKKIDKKDMKAFRLALTGNIKVNY